MHITISPHCLVRGVRVILLAAGQVKLPGTQAVVLIADIHPHRERQHRGLTEFGAQAQADNDAIVIQVIHIQ